MTNVLLIIAVASFIMCVVLAIVAAMVFVKTNVRDAILFLQNKTVLNPQAGGSRTHRKRGVAHVARTSGVLSPSQASPVAGQAVVMPQSEPPVLADSESPTTLLQEESENPTTLLIEESENPTTLLQEESENPTTLLVEESENPTTLLQEESENPTTLLEEETERPTSLLDLEESERATTLLDTSHAEAKQDAKDEPQETFKFEIKQKDLLINTDERIEREG